MIDNWATEKPEEQWGHQNKDKKCTTYNTGSAQHHNYCMCFHYKVDIYVTLLNPADQGGIRASFQLVDRLLHLSMQLQGYHAHISQPLYPVRSNIAIIEYVQFVWLQTTKAIPAVGLQSTQQNNANKCIYIQTHYWTTTAGTLFKFLQLLSNKCNIFYAFLPVTYLLLKQQDMHFLRNAEKLPDSKKPFVRNLRQNFTFTVTKTIGSFIFCHWCRV